MDGSRVRGIIDFEIMDRNLFKLLIAAIWSADVIVKYTRVVVYRFTGISENAAFILEYSFFTLLALLAFPYMRKRTKLSAILAYILFASVYLTFMFISNTKGAEEYLQENVWFYLLANLPLIFVGFSLNNDDDIKWLRLISLLSIFVNLLCILVMGSNGMNLSDDNMGLSYALVPHVCLLLFYSMVNRKTIDIFFFVLGFVMIVAYGTRGPILCAACTFIGIWLLLNWKKMTIPKITGIITVSALLLSVIWYIMPLIGLYLIRSGFSDRLVSMMMSGEFSSDFGRSMIQDVVIEQIQRNPGGYGLAYDRILVDLWGNKISYSHNIVLELWISFGVIIGSLLFLALIVLVIKGVASAPTVTLKGFLIALICGKGLIRLFLSGTFLDSPDTYLMIGMCLGLIWLHKHQSKYVKKVKIRDIYV